MKKQPITGWAYKFLQPRPSAKVQTHAKTYVMGADGRWHSETCVQTVKACP